MRPAILTCTFSLMYAMLPAQDFAMSKLVPDRTSVWVGEVFGLTYELSVLRRLNPQVSGTLDWNPLPLSIEGWSKPEGTEVMFQGEPGMKVAFRTRAVAKASGSVDLAPVRHAISVKRESRMGKAEVASDHLLLDVRPLPSPPIDFSGAVGQIKMVSVVRPQKVALNEPISWIVEVSGSASWPETVALPVRIIPEEFRTEAPKRSRISSDEKPFDTKLLEEFTLVPTRIGTFTLRGTTFTYFDPQAGKYATVSTPETLVEVIAARN